MPFRKHEFDHLGLGFIIELRFQAENGAHHCVLASSKLKLEDSEGFKGLRSASARFVHGFKGSSMARCLGSSPC